MLLDHAILTCGTVVACCEFKTQYPVTLKVNKNKINSTMKGIQSDLSNIVSQTLMLLAITAAFRKYSKAEKPNKSPLNPESVWNPG